MASRFWTRRFMRRHRQGKKVLSLESDGLEINEDEGISAAADNDDMLIRDVIEVSQSPFLVPKDEEEDIPRSVIERYAASVPPPRGGQNIRAPIHGVNTKRCQEWTMEVLRLLAQQKLIPEDAVRIAEAERDPATHGIFGYNDQRA